MLVQPRNNRPGTVMKQRVVILSLLLSSTLALSPLSAAAQSGSGALNEKELTGMRLFNQSCRVCHTRPLLNSAQYGPVLSKDTLGGDETALRDFISTGTPRMPGFKATYTPDQIGAIAAYLKTVPVPPASPQ
jgi:mono/diheme cytochrome c family protein